MKTLLFLSILLITGNQLYAQKSLIGKWEGGITVPGGQLKIVFDISGDLDKLTGTLDIPQQGARGLRFESISQKKDSIELVFSAGQMRGTFSGAFENESTISGMYSQGVGETPFSVERVEVGDSKEDRATNETELIIQNGEVEIGGTLTVPKGEIKAPLLIMSSGSGAQDRDSNIFDFKMFKVIAQELSKQGIPSFRYDDRGINKSSGNFVNATLDDLVGDVEAIINFFTNDEANKFERFSVLGHSQGGVVAGKIAKKHESIVQLILMGSTGPSLSEILTYQVEFAYKGTPVEQHLIEAEVEAREILMKAIVNEENVDEAKLKYKNAYLDILNGLPEAQRNSIPSMDAMAENQSTTLEMSFNSPQMKSLLFYVPVNDLEMINIPTLVLVGGKDTQVTISQNLEPIEKALEKSGTAYEVITFPEANHLFQKAENGNVSEYPFLKKEFIDGFLSNMSSWILNEQ
ncbi:MAG: alpha/beta fold hydrolase [Balneolaceae bacterium]